MTFANENQASSDWQLIKAIGDIFKELTNSTQGMMPIAFQARKTDRGAQT
jgi:hypothetical protein